MRKANSAILTGVKGFTLIELMVVVAIIGILATIGGAQYQKFQAKARQSEAKLALAAIYSAEKSFATENSTYSSCLGNIGYAPDGWDTASSSSKGKNYYSVGFNDTDAAATTGCGPAGLSPCNAFTDYSAGASAQTCTPGNGATFFVMNSRANSGYTIPTTNPLGSTTPMTQNTFKASAAGNVSTSSAGLDVWTIDENKNLVNTTPVL